MFSKKIKQGHEISKPKKAAISKQLISLDVGSKTTKMIVGKLKGKKIYIDLMNGEINSRESSFDGKIINFSDMQNTVRSLMNKNQVKIKDIVCTVESTDLIRREMDIMSVPKADMIGLVKHEISQYLPIDISSYLLQVKQLGAFEENKIKKIKVAVGAMPKNIAESHINLLQSLNLEQYAMDINSNALEKLISLEIENSSSSEFKNRNVVFIDMGHSFFNISIFGNGQYLFNKIIDIGGNMIDTIIAERMRISKEEAEVVKIKNSTQYSLIDLMRTFNSNSQPKTMEEMVLFETLGIMETWASEINQVLKYYTTRNRSNTIDGIYLFGGGSFINGIEEFIENRLQLPAKTFIDFRCIEVSGQGLNKNILNYLNAVGALIRN